MQNKTLQMKRALRTALLVLLLSVVGMGKMVAQDFTAGNLNYSINTDGATVTVTGHVNGTAAIGSLVIPESVIYEGIVYDVTSIGNYAFENCSGFTGNLTIPNSVTTIGKCAFNECSGFTGNLTIPNSVTTIGDRAFRKCSGFTGSLTIGNSVTMIGYGAFQYCRGFTGNLIIPNSVTTIGMNAFHGCSGFTGTLTIGTSVTTIDGWAFWNCNGLTGTLTIPNSVTSIGTNPFLRCPGLEHIEVASGNTVYDSRNHCNAIIKTNTNELISGCNASIIPNSVTKIGDNAFAGCSGLIGNIVIPNSVTSIGHSAFSDCSGLTGTLTISNFVTSIGINPFQGCSGLDRIEVGSENTVYDSRNNCNAIIESATNALITGIKYTTIPESVTIIREHAFTNCTDLLSIGIPQNITSIEEAAFANCNNLYSVISYAAVPPTLGSSVFYYVPCTTLTVPCECFSDYEVSS